MASRRASSLLLPEVLVPVLAAPVVTVTLLVEVTWSQLIVATLSPAALAPLRVNVIRVLVLLIAGPLVTDKPALKPAAGIAGVMQVPEARFKVQVTLPALPLHVDVPVFQDELSSLLMMLLASWLA